MLKRYFERCIEHTFAALQHSIAETCLEAVFGKHAIIRMMRLDTNNPADFSTAIARAQSRLTNDGYVVLPGFVPTTETAALKVAAEAELAGLSGPIELESDLGYAGAPASRSAAGGQTPRRLLDAYNRSTRFAALATAPKLRALMRSYFGGRTMMSQVHHNCLMTKHPRYGSSTGWHRDFRYWSFEENALLSVWFALGEETEANGAVRFIPRSHRMSFAGDRYDEAKFLRDDLPSNTDLIRESVCPTLMAGDAVVFHSNTLHSAGRNTESVVKLSLVFTYHADSNRPLPQTRSASRAEISLD